MNAEQARLQQGAKQTIRPWDRWGPFVSERSWGTVREDYSPDGSAWEYFPHDHARSKAYRWGEDGLAGWCDRYQVLVFSLALWNERDPILKERLFGLVPSEANHGEDVKEYYFYLDATPTHSYLKYLYKYPQAEFPYGRLLEENRRRSSHEREFELLDTGVFDEDRYFDVFVEYAKGDTEDTCIRIEAVNRGPDPAPLHLIPQLWFRNSWSWGASPKQEPVIAPGPGGDGCVCILADDLMLPLVKYTLSVYGIGQRFLYAEPGRVAGARGRSRAGPAPTLLFTNNETHSERVYGPWARSRSPYVKDAFHRRIIGGEDCTNPDQQGTKAGLHYAFPSVPPGGSAVIRLRLTGDPRGDPFGDHDRVLRARREEADRFYDDLHPPGASEDERRIQRQALAGMIWSKQVYLFNVLQWQDGDNPDWPPPAGRAGGRNAHWRHLNSQRIMSMPDKWEYPWFAAWDLAYQCVTLALVDPGFAKEQLWLLLFEQFQHRNGQIPAYEWEFSDLNPPVHPWAVWRVYNMERHQTGVADRVWLERCFHKLLVNFAWWVNRVDSHGNDVFEGGFLGLDNITILDRSHELPHGATLEQSDGTGWMGLFCLSMLRIALELAGEDLAYQAMATKFFEHYAVITTAMKTRAGDCVPLWDQEDGFFYDILRLPGDETIRLRIRSLVGLIPLFAVERLEERALERFPEFQANFNWFLRSRKEQVQECITTLNSPAGRVHVCTIVNPEQLRRILTRLWDPGEFRSDFGVRSLSRAHAEAPYILGERRVGYEPGEAVAGLKGGNSNWRGPVWFPTTFLIIESLRKLRAAYGDDFTIPNPEPGGPPVTLAEMASGLAEALLRIFARSPRGRRPVFGDEAKFQSDVHWRDNLLFFEHFHGDDGRGLGASHQTGWTGLIANIIDEWRR